MPNNTGLLLLGLGALLFLGRGGAAKKPDEDNRFLSGLDGGAPRSPFNIQAYVDALFRDTTTVPIQPPMKMFYPATVIVTSSGVPGASKGKPELITPTTKVQIGGEGGETITASALAVLRTEQIKKQNFDYAANVQPKTWAATADANQIEEARQMQFAKDLIAKNRAAQAAAQAVQKSIVAQTRLEQENLARGLNADGSARRLPKGMSVIGFSDDVTPTITVNENTGQWTYSNPDTASAGQDILIEGEAELDVDFTPEYSETFVISGGMDSPVFAGEEDDPRVPTTVHEVTAQYVIGF